MFYIKMLRCSVQTVLDCRPEVVTYFSDVTTVSYDLCKAQIIDANSFKYKPSVIAAALVFLGLQLQFEQLIVQGKLSNETRDSRELVH